MESLTRIIFTISLLPVILNLNSQTAPGGVLSSTECRLWLDAGDLNGDAIYSNNPPSGTPVGTWSDKSGNANNLTQAVAANQPVLNTLAGTPVVRWDNTGANINFMNVTTQAMLSPGTIYFAIRMLDAGDGANCLFDRTGAGFTSMRFEQWNGTDVLGYTKYSTADYTSTLSSIYGSNLVVSYLKTSASDNVDIAINNSSVNLAIGSANPGLPLYVLGKNNASDGMNGYVMEVLAYNTNLNYAQKMIIDNYLSAKYSGITIISDKYAGDTPGNGNYDFELGGIGNEGGGSNTSVSASVTGGLEAVQATAFEAGEYLMYAHQSTPTNSVNTTDIGGMSPGPARGRWERIWYLDWTHVAGSNESVNLIFDFSDGGVGGSPAGATPNYKLIYRAGTSGNWTEVMNASSVSGDRVTFNGVAWNTAGDGYYTIGSQNLGSSPLPVEFLKLNAESCGEGVCVSWSTASERNCNHFIVEKSINGLEWETITIRKAAGNSSRRIDYGVYDDEPITGISYYRVTSVDFDNSRETTPIVSVYRQPAYTELVVSPNPARSELNVRVGNFAIQKVIFELLAMDGRSIFLHPSAIRAEKASFEVSTLKRGIYILVARLPDGSRIKRKIILQ